MSVARFIPVADITDPLPITLGISGASGTGKTYSALLIARGMAEAATGAPGSPIGIIDTENRRALHYRADFPEMVHMDLKAVGSDGDMLGFGPERWIAAIDEAEAAGVPVLVIDSFSHAWEGIDGVLDRQALALDRLVEAAVKRSNGREVNPDSYNQLSWAEVKPPYRRLIDRIVRARTNIVLCTRAKPVIQSGFGGSAKNARKTKTRRDDIPWDPASDADLMFEMTAMVMLDPKAPGCPVYLVKCADQFRRLFDPTRPLGAETGRAMVEWARGGGQSQAEKRVLDEARDQAREGKAAFTQWWQDHPQSRSLVRTILADCQRLAAEADAARLQDQSDPFASKADAAEAGDAEDGAAEVAEIERKAALAMTKMG